MAGGNEKRLNMLKRFASPIALAEAQEQAREKISKGQLRQPLKEGATPEEVAEYRAANGVPEAPEKYDTSLPDGLVIGEADKPLVDGYLKYAHDKNIPNEVVKANLGWYYQEQTRQAEAQFERDASGKVAVVDDLKAEYGPNYKRYVAHADSFMLKAGESFRDSLMQARMPDGSLVGANPTAVRWLINTALELDPVGTVDPAGNSTSLATAEAELAGLIKESGNRGSDYWKGPMAQGKQARHLELVRMMEKVKARK